MNRFRMLLHASALAVVVAVFANGCQKADSTDSAATRVVVYDIDRVAHDMGWMTDMQTNLQALQKQFQTDFKHAQDMYGQQITDQKHKWAPKDTDKLTAEQQDALNKMAASANEVLSQLNQKANQQFNVFRQQWVIQYREALKPVLEQVAEERKLAIILEKNDTVQFAQPSSDITDAVIDSARAHPPIVNPVPMPTLPTAPAMELKWPATQVSASKPAGSEATTQP
jgi:Skp family chaperone for outer membrane proteins